MRNEEIAPVLVLALGNVLLRDDGVGLELLRELQLRYGGDPRVALVDGGTQGVALLGVLSSRRALLVLDALAADGEPGSVSITRDPLKHATPRGFGAHGANATGLLASAELLGDLPTDLALVGVTPGKLETGIGLSEPVQRAIPEALELAAKTLEAMLARVREGDPSSTS
jgi:hydrogenase maturation protease